MANILVIDDDDAVRRTARVILERSGHSVAEASNGKHGLQWLKDNQADLVLTDIFMPDTDGVETIRAVRQSFPSAKIVAMSGSRQNEHYLKVAGELGADAVLDKPFRGTQLNEIVLLVLDAPRKQTATGA